MEDHDELTHDELVNLIESRFKEFLAKRPRPEQILSLYTRMATLIEESWWDQWSDAGIQQALDDGIIDEDDAAELRKQQKE